MDIGQTFHNLTLLRKWKVGKRSKRAFSCSEGNTVLLRLEMWKDCLVHEWGIAILECIKETVYLKWTWSFVRNLVTHQLQAEYYVKGMLPVGWLQRLGKDRLEFFHHWIEDAEILCILLTAGFMGLDTSYSQKVLLSAFVWILLLLLLPLLAVKWCSLFEFDVENTNFFFFSFHMPSLFPLGWCTYQKGKCNVALHAWLSVALFSLIYGIY